jgi:hypothetical protein
LRASRSCSCLTGRRSCSPRCMHWPSASA